MHDWDQEHVHGDEEEMREEDHPLWSTDRVELVSVGIDIGSATSQVIFSRLVLRRMGHELSSRYVVQSRESLFRSPVALTGYRPDESIDVDGLGTFVTGCYREAGLEPGSVDTGAVILTGEAIRRHNARAIADMFASEGGRFVCATAGHHMEAMLAAFGSGTAAAAHDRGERLLNIDIGGGTTKLAAVDRGRVTETAALHVGGRLLAYDDGGEVTRLEPGGAEIARRAGVQTRLGARIGDADLQRMGEWMAEAVLAAVSPGTMPADVADLFVTPPIQDRDHFDGIVFSGGVGEYVYGSEARSYGDLGRSLGTALARRLREGALPWPLLPSRECIRATVVGASQYSVQVSGNTIFLSEPAILPLRNIRVLRPPYDLAGEIEPEGLAEAVRRHAESFDIDIEATDVALAFHWHGDPSFPRLNAFAEGLRRGLADAIAAGRPVVLTFDHDVGKLVGALLKEEQRLGCEVLSLDGLALRDFDFVDIGRQMEPSGTVPVTIKSLVFQL